MHHFLSGMILQFNASVFFFRQCIPVYFSLMIYTILSTLWLFNIAMEAMAHRNRWFTCVYLLNMGGFSMAK